MAKHNPQQEQEPKISTDSSLNQFGPLEFEDFLDYMKSEKKASFIVLYTAKGEGSCETCTDLYDEFQAVSVSHKRSPQFNDDKLFFGCVDFCDEQEIYEKINVDKAPVIMHYPPSGKPRQADNMNLTTRGIHAEVIAKWVEERTRIKIKILPPSLFHEPQRFYKTMYKRTHALVTNPTTIGSVATIFCFEMTSGIISAGSERDLFGITEYGPVFFMSNVLHRQYPIESYIIMALYCGFSAGMNLLIRGTTKKDTEKTIKCGIGLAIIIVLFSVILAVFRVKLNGYPFRILF